METANLKLTDIKLKITFPFARNDDLNETTIYQKIVNKLIKPFVEDNIYISFNRNNKGVISMKSIVDFIFALDENVKRKLEYPSIELISQNGFFENNFICIKSFEKIVLELKDTSGNNYELLENHLKAPPIQLKNMIIYINCDIEYLFV